MDGVHNIGLTSGEIASLWSSYMNDSMSVCVIQYFLEKVEDTEVRPVLEYALSLAQKHIQKVTEIFNKEQYPIPHGFTNEDVNLSTPRLYSDTFMLIYIQNMGKIGMNGYSMALANTFREDVMTFYKECLATSSALFEMASKVMLSKGTMVRAPRISIPSMIDFVKKQSFLTGWFGERRPLSAVEVGNLFFNIQRNALGRSLLMGFGQVAESKEVREFMARGKEISSKHIEIFGSVLTKNDLPTPSTWDATPTNSITSPFSDKLMMFHVVALIAAGIGHYAAGMATSMRRDLSVHYVRLTAEISAYAEDGANIMIENGWLEQPPLASDREALANA
jgi:hypothetical protein